MKKTANKALRASLTNEDPSMQGKPLDGPRQALRAVKEALGVYYTEPLILPTTTGKEVDVKEFILWGIHKDKVDIIGWSMDTGDVRHWRGQDIAWPEGILKIIRRSFDVCKEKR